MFFKEDYLNKLNLIDTSERSIKSRDLVGVYCSLCRSENKAKFSYLKEISILDNKYVCRKCSYVKIGEKIKQTGKKSIHYSEKDLACFGLTDTKPRFVKKRDLVEVCCNMCEEKHTLQFETVKQLYNKHKTPYMCRKCSNHHRRDGKKIYLKLQKTLKEKYGISNPGQKENSKEKHKLYISEKIGKYPSEILGNIGIVDTSERYISGSETVEASCDACKTNKSLKFSALLRLYQTNNRKYLCKKCAFNSIDKKKANKERKKTCLEKYGHESVMQLPEVREKVLKTCFDRFGYTYPTKSDVVKNKTKETNMDKYGYENPSQSPDIKEKVKNTFMKKYGYKNSLSSPEIRKKIKKTILEKYGHENAMQSPEVREKVLKTLADKDYSSKGELELKNWIYDKFNLYAKKSYIGGNNPKEIDILVKDSNDNNILAIEYNGDFYHSEARTGNKTNHFEKTKLVKSEKNCQLIHIFESEWVDKKEIVKSFIESKITKGIAIRASKCEIRHVSWEDAKEFCDKNHLQGKPNHSILSIGLYHKDELISLMTFSRPHRQTMNSLPNLSRYCIKGNYRIHGGLSKLSKYAHSQLGDFITFVHKRLSDGESYLKSGYVKIGDVKPDYWYWDTKKNKVVSKQSRRKSAVGTPVNMTEKEHAALDGLYRVWDCGKIKLIYKK